LFSWFCSISQAQMGKAWHELRKRRIGSDTTYQLAWLNGIYSLLGKNIQHNCAFARSLSFQKKLRAYFLPPTNLKKMVGESSDDMKMKWYITCCWISTGMWENNISKIYCWQSRWWDRFPLLHCTFSFLNSNSATSYKEQNYYE